jgi:hypothetical protein
MRTETVGDRRIMDNPILRDRLLRLQAEVAAMKFNGLRVLSASINGERSGGSRG